MLKKLVFGFVTMAAFGAAARPALAGIQLKCEGVILGRAIEAFNFAISEKGGGIFIYDYESGSRISIGKEIDVRSVEVQNINKDAFQVTFNLERISGAANRGKLRLLVHSVNSATCEFFDGSATQLSDPLFKLID